MITFAHLRCVSWSLLSLIICLVPKKISLLSKPQLVKVRFWNSESSVFRLIFTSLWKRFTFSSKKQLIKLEKATKSKHTLCCIHNIEKRIFPSVDRSFALHRVIGNSPRTSSTKRRNQLLQSSSCPRNCTSLLWRSWREVERNVYEIKVFNFSL